jgi:arginine deiminase
MSNKLDFTIQVTSETNRLRRLLVHSPDSGLGKVVPSKAQDWLFEDIVHLDTIRRKEYDYYTKLLMYFLDYDKIKGKLKEIDHSNNKRGFYKPDHEDFHKSEYVVELQWLLSEILEDSAIKSQMIAAVCALENCTYETQEKLSTFSPIQLAKVIISGTHNDNEMLFPPIPNFIFTRDIGITINKHILLNKPAKKARTREALIVKYILFNHKYFKEYKNNIIELEDTQHHFLLPKEAQEHKVTLEGGDVMTVSDKHVLIGVSERTTWDAAYHATKVLFEKNVVDKVTIVKIPRKRDYMHIDTVFTQVKKNIWVLLGIFSHAYAKKLELDPIEKALDMTQKKNEDKVKIIQFQKDNLEKPKTFKSIEALLRNISVKDLGCKPNDVQIILSGNNVFPYDAREQWTDSCNLLAIKDGVVIGYDRNDKTVDAFHQVGFKSVYVEDLIADFESGKIMPDEVEDTIILMPSAELSRARGGFHCMSMPLWRDIDE